MDPKRSCFLCGAHIDLCMGYVRAGDFVLAASGQLAVGELPRELCGRCVFKIDFGVISGDTFLTSFTEHK